MGRRLEYEVKTSVRFNMNNPQHVKINNVLQNLDPNIFKSKNQFIIDACQFYIDHYGEEQFMEKKERKRVRYNIMLSEGENTYANDEWSRLLPDIRHNATVDLDAVFGEFQLINPRAKSFLCGIQAAFITLDIDMADELIRKRERSLKGAARAKLSRTKEFDHSKWVGGGMLDYRFSNARRIVNDIYAGEVSADV